MPSDVTPEMQARHDELVRKASPAQRIRALSGMVRSGRRMLEATLRRQFPNAPDEELQARLVARLYGRATAARYFARVPEDAS